MCSGDLVALLLATPRNVVHLRFEVGDELPVSRTGGWGGVDGGGEEGARLLG